MSDSVRPHGWQPTRLPSLGFSRQEHWSGLHFLLQRMKVKSESEVAQSCPTLHDPMDCSLPGSSAHGIFQARVLEWVTSAFSCKSGQKLLLACSLECDSPQNWPSESSLQWSHTYHCSAFSLHKIPFLFFFFTYQAIVCLKQFSLESPPWSKEPVLHKYFRSTF